MKNKSKFLYLIIIHLLFFISCSEKLRESKFPTSPCDEITGKCKDSDKTTSQNDQIDIDIYIDATTSMEGFAVSNNSIYSQFLDQLEASPMSAWKKADLKFFKFGERIKLIDRSEFLTAKNELKFYREKGIKLKTYIDSVVNRTDTKRLSVLVTDLFQNESDVNSMVEKIKEKCFSRGIMVGIMGIESQFKGTVYDVPEYPKGYSLDTLRPFYAIMFGNQDNMEKLFESLKTKPFVKEEQLMVFSKYIIRSYNIDTLFKTKESKFVNKKASAKSEKNSFDFSMKEEGKEAKFNLEINIDRNTRCADFSEKNIEVIAFKKSVSNPKIKHSDSIPTNDMSLENIKRTGNILSATVILKNEDGLGNYSYVVLIKANEMNGLLPPKWVINFSTDNPIVNTPSASKTYNLEKFANRLIVANSTISPTYIAKFYINIYKR